MEPQTTAPKIATEILAYTVPKTRRDARERLQGPGGGTARPVRRPTGGQSVFLQGFRILLARHLDEQRDDQHQNGREQQVHREREMVDMPERDVLERHLEEYGHEHLGEEQVGHGADPPGVALARADSASASIAAPSFLSRTSGSREQT